jgi:DNA (cytosine-5)-methyltransferase 1
VEAASLAWEPLGWTPAFFAEVDPFCRKLLAYRWPQVPNLGDVTRADFAERAAALGPVDVLVGGTPCQSFSIAGRRGGLADARGNLTLRYLEILAAVKPTWLVWENVPGVLSDDGGRTFGTVLGRMADLGYRLAYRVLDAALAGVPQRRRRVFVVGHSGTRCPGEVLALSEGQGRDSQAGGESRPEAAADAGRGPAAVTPGGVFVNNGMDKWYEQPVSGTVVARGGEDGYTTGLLVEVVAVLGTVAHALTCEGGSEDGTGRGVPVVAFHVTQDPISGEVAPAMGCGNRQGCGTVGVAYAEPQGVRYVVRRLTPRECERLQGFPDDHTLIPVKPAGKTRRKDREYVEIDGVAWELAADGPRYRAIGNSMAVPVMRQIGARIDDLVREG